MTDIHCHLLPAMDDGAQNIDCSAGLLKQEKENGVDQIILTSHYNCEQLTLSDYKSLRQDRFEQLLDLNERLGLGIRFKLGAEVYYSPDLNYIDIGQLCMGDTDYLLIEFSTIQKPFHYMETLESLMGEGIVPIIAHIERYPYFLEDLRSFYKMAEAGALFQVNAGTVIHQPKTIMKLIQHGFVHVIASDAHSPDKRYPRQKEAFNIIRKKFGNAVADRLIRNSDHIFAGRDIESVALNCPKKIMNHWFF